VQLTLGPVLGEISKRAVAGDLASSVQARLTAYVTFPAPAINFTPLKHFLILPASSERQQRNDLHNPILDLGNRSTQGVP
jgi:hypothetical protein